MFRKSSLYALLFLLLGALLVPSTVAAGKFQESPLYVVDGDGETADGGFATLKRQNNDRVKLLVDTTVEPHHVITIWWIVFNNPEACSDPCDLNDLPPFGGDPAVQAASLWGAGGIADSQGRIRLKSTLPIGDPPGQAMPFSPPDGILDQYKAEIHVILRTHGPEQPGLLHAQMTTFSGGCNNMPPQFGTPGNFACADAQFAMFMPQH